MIWIDSFDGDQVIRRVWIDSNKISKTLSIPTPNTVMSFGSEMLPAASQAYSQYIPLARPEKEIFAGELATVITESKHSPRIAIRSFSVSEGTRYITPSSELKASRKSALI